MSYCDVLGCNNKSKHVFFNGLLKTCDEHKDYHKLIKYRLLNLRHNCGRKKKH